MTETISDMNRKLELLSKLSQTIGKTPVANPMIQLMSMNQLESAHQKMEPIRTITIKHSEEAVAEYESTPLPTENLF